MHSNLAHAALTLVTIASPFIVYFNNRKRDRRKMWTENNDGINLPPNMDTSEHSGAVEPEIVACKHTEIEPAGTLPNGDAIQRCMHCGIWERIGIDIGESLFGGSR